MGQRKLQIFLSSTYLDLIQYRLAAMEAILAGGHIPAAMEQFDSGDMTAWEKIKTLIDGSDAFILLLGGRYGSIDDKSGKSFTHLEYDYALKKKKPFMSLVITTEALNKRSMAEGPKVKEEGHETEYRNFRSQVMKKLCKEWSDEKDIKIAILQKLPVWNDQQKLKGKGWIRAEEAASPETLNELTRLSSENRTLREQLATKSDTFDGLHFEEIVKLLREDTDLGKIDELLTVIQDAPKNVGHLFDLLMDTLAVEPSQFIDKGYFKHLDSIPQIQLLKKHNLIKTDIAREDEIRASHIITKNIPPRLYLTDVGRRFRNKLLMYGDKEKRYRELWHVPDSETPSSEN